MLQKNEGKSLEFKENTHGIKNILKTVVAFANTSGGTLVIGIKDKTKSVIGVENPLQDEERILNAISDAVAPLMIPGIEIYSHRSKEVLIVRIPHLLGPCYLRHEGEEHGIYIRSGSTNRKADATTIHALRLLAANKSFDTLPAFHGSLTLKEVQSVFATVRKKPTKKQCEALGIYTEHFGEIYPTMGGVLLFSQKRCATLPDAQIRCACFLGTTKEKILDSIEIEEVLPLAIDPIHRFIERNSRTEMEFGTMRRVDLPQFPPEAIRELLINAILHADYNQIGAHIQIALFSDRIEISNPGGLPFGQTLEKALSGCSRLRNPVIGRVFQELKLTERWGSGLKRVHEICKKRGLKKPKFEESINFFRVTLYSAKETPLHLTNDEEILIEYLTSNQSIQTKDASNLWNLSDRAARTRLSKLCNQGILTRLSTSDKDPRGAYILNEDRE